MKKRVTLSGKRFLMIWVVAAVVCLLMNVYAQTMETAPAVEKEPRAAFITCNEMVDEGLFESIKRRTEQAIAEGCDYLVYEIDTFGGRVDSAYNIWSYILQDINKREGLHTIAYVRTKAISAGALISVSCQNIVMKENTQIGDCAPISMGGELEGVEREKVESPLRSFFATAAQANGYPEGLLKAMVTIGIEVWRVKNLETGDYEYFESDMLPDDGTKYDLEGKKRIDSDEHLLTLSAAQALEYGISQATVQGSDDGAREGVLAFLEARDGVAIVRPLSYYQPNWSEQMVRWVTSPAVSGILMLIGMLGIYIEIKTPGIGLPAAIAVIAFGILFGSKFLIGMANWWEIGVFILGVLLLLVEIFAIPGFGVAGILGIVLIFFGLIAMMVNNPPDRLPIPVSPMDWEQLQSYMISMFLGLLGFIIVAFFLARYLPGLPVARRLILASEDSPIEVRSGGFARPSESVGVTVGQVGITTSTLRPCGIAEFDDTRLDVISQGELIEPGRKVQVVAIEGNEVIVRSVNEV